MLNTLVTLLHLLHYPLTALLFTSQALSTMGGFLKKLLVGRKSNKGADVNILQDGAPKHHDESPTVSTPPSPQMPSHSSTNTAKPDPKQVAWCNEMNNVLNMQRQVTKHAGYTRAELKKWRETFAHHVLGRDNTRGWDYTEGDREYRRIIHDLKCELDEDELKLKWIQEEYDELIAREREVFGLPPPRASAGLPSDEFFQLVDRKI